MKIDATKKNIFVEFRTVVSLERLIKVDTLKCWWKKTSFKLSEHIHIFIYMQIKKKTINTLRIPHLPQNLIYYPYYYIENSTEPPKGV